MRKSIRDRLSPQDKDDLYHRRVSVRDMAKKYGVTESHLSRTVPERAPRLDKNTLKRARNLYRNQILQETLKGKHTIAQTANLINTSERTVFRKLAALRATLKEQNHD